MFAVLFGTLCVSLISVHIPPVVYNAVYMHVCRMICTVSAADALTDTETLKEQYYYR